MVTKAVETRQSMYPLRAVDRVCDIIDLLAQHPSGITLSAIAAAVQLPKSSAFRYLAALEVRGYVTRSDDGIGYRLGAPLASSHPVVSGKFDRLVKLAKPYTDLRHIGESLLRVSTERLGLVGLLSWLREQVAEA